MPPPKCSQGCQEIRLEMHGQGRGAAQSAIRPRTVGGQLQQRHVRQVLSPICHLTFQGSAAQGFALPGGKVRVLNGEVFKESAAVEGTQLPQ